MLLERFHKDRVNSSLVLEQRVLSRVRLDCLEIRQQLVRLQNIHKLVDYLEGDVHARQHSVFQHSYHVRALQDRRMKPGWLDFSQGLENDLVALGFALVVRQRTGIEEWPELRGFGQGWAGLVGLVEEADAEVGHEPVGVNRVVLRH